MQLWSIVLSGYDCCIEYRRSEQHINCDAISRLLHEDSEIAGGGESEINIVGAIDGDFPIKAKDIGKATRLDPLLSRVLDFVLTGWPEKCYEEEMKPYYSRRKKLSCEKNFVLWGSRVIIPYVFRKKILKELHWEHPGICAMKAIARKCVWWHKMDGEIEGAVKLCTVCKNVRISPPSVPLILWKWPTRPFQRIHLDFCQKRSDHFLVVADSHLKRLEVKTYVVNHHRASVDELRLIFA